MRRPRLLIALLAGCASAPPPLEPASLPVAEAYLARRDVAVAREVAEVPTPRASTGRSLMDEVRGLIDGDRIDALRGLAADEDALTRRLAEPVTPEDLAVLAYLRSPAVRAARKRVDAVRTGYAQAADLKDLVSLYRSNVRETRTRVGPQKSLRATGSLAPAPNVEALSGEIVRLTVEIAFEEMRATIRDLVAAAERAHADAARLVAARRILQEDVKLHESLVAAMRSRLESGQADQAGLLAFQGRLEALRTELDILERERVVVRARWNRILSRADGAALNLDVESPAPLDAADPVPVALRDRQELRAAALRADRAGTAVRLAETMTLPRMDLGTSRFERERAGEVGAQRGAVFPDSGRMITPRWDFGVREAQVSEVRARQAAAESARAALRDRVREEVHEALFSVQAAGRRWRVHERDLVPLAERAFASSRGAYEANRIGYIELLDRARGLLDARLGRVDARRDHAHARAALLRAVGVRTTVGR